MRLLSFPMMQKNLKCSPELDEGIPHCSPPCSPPCFMECRHKWMYIDRANGKQTILITQPLLPSLWQKQDEREHNVVNISWRYCYSPYHTPVAAVLAKIDLDLTPTRCYLMYAVAAWMMEIKNKGPKQEQSIVRKLNLNPMAYERHDSVEHKQKGSAWYYLRVPEHWDFQSTKMEKSNWSVTEQNLE